MFAQVGIDVAVPSYTSRVDTDIHLCNQDWCGLSVELYWACMTCPLQSSLGS
ncbi:hypothetical protein FIBSPDRAFT_865799 [Athelia psychrophila]|uniref:Uncharacterized protein n=1 Tax=Athelia psychrophila TaxID=1759441 RepID=A0A166FCH0_9AGAM|nr:hypothetical protein FIBSPDRAFT_865799 [Fibularhizoctonia sp. CBS 109695]